MSEIVTVSISAVTLGIAGVLLPTAAVAIALAAAGARLSAHRRRLLDELTADVPKTLQTIQPAPLQHTPSDLKSALASAARLAVADADSLAATLRARPIEEWAAIIRENHQQLFRETLLDAVARACRKLGCTVEVSGGQLTAQDPGGRGLAVEISDQGAVKAEVLGVADGSCHVLLDRFLQALESEGVQIAKVNERRWTGGAPQTEAGRKWVAKRTARPAAVAQRKPGERGVKRVKEIGSSTRIRG